jgi:hypothetical protein
MLSRALIIATVMLLIGCLTAIPVRAENLEAGKSPSQIFAGTCAACHKGMRGLLKTVAPGSLPGFLRQHYTTSSEMAAMLSAYVLSNGATDTRPGGSLTKQGKDAKSEPKPAAATEQAEPRPGRRPRPGAPQDAGKPDADGLAAAQRGEPRGGEPGARPGHNAKRLARPGADETAKPAGEGQPPSAAEDAGGRPLSAKQKLGKRGKPGREEPPRNDAGAAKTEPAKDEPPKGEAAKTETPKDIKDEGTKTGVAKPAEEGKPETAKTEASKPEGTGTEAAKPEAAKGEASRGETPLRADPVPAVTPAPKPSEGEAKPTQTATPAAPAASEPAPPPPAARPAPPAAEASTPPVAPAGPPMPPISQ